MSGIRGEGGEVNLDGRSIWEKLNSLRESIDWNNKDERLKLFRRLDSLLSEWKDRVPNLEVIIDREKVDWLLSEAVKMCNSDKDKHEGERIIDWVVLKGYKDKPAIDQDGKPLSRRTTPLHRAARDECKDSEVIRNLFKIYNNFEVNYVDEFGLTHFHIACQHLYGYHDIVEKFLELGQVDPNLLVPETGDTPLHLALRNRQRATFELLLRRGGDPNLANANGSTPLHVICSRGDNDELVQALLFETGGRDDELGRMPLESAVANARKRNTASLRANMKGLEMVLGKGKEMYYDHVAKMLFELGDDRYQPLRVNAQDKLGNTPLHLALLYESKEMVELLLRRGGDPNLANAAGSTALHLISSRGLVDLAEMLFELGHEVNRPVQVNAQDKLGNTPLHLALLYESKEMVELLLRRGGDPNLANSAGSTALHLISSRGLVDLAEMLFELGHVTNRPVQFDARDRFGNTPLLLVVDHAHEHLTPKEKYLGNPLRSAYKDYRFEIRAAELAYTWLGYTTADTIESRRRKDLVQLLLRQGADSNLANADGLTPLHCICKDYYNDDPDLAQIFLDNTFNRPCRVDAQDNSGETPLHLALKYDNIQVAELLLRSGADPNLANEDGLTSLHHICQRSRFIDGIVEIFFRVNDELNQRVHIDAPDKSGNRPLHLALRHNNGMAVQTLLERGANPNSTDAEGLTSLHLIYVMGYHGRTKMLLEICDRLNQPLEIEARDKLGRTPLQWAVAGLQPEVVDVLLDRGADLSNFVFPDESHFDECLKLFKSVEVDAWIWKSILQLGFGALAVVQQLEKRGYELDRSDVSTIVTLFGTHGLFEKSKLERPTDAEICWYDDEEFTSKAKETMINSTYSLYDLTRMEPKEAKKMTLFSDYFKFMRENGLREFSVSQSEACPRYIFEKLSRGFFQEWAMDPFWTLIHYRLPSEMCELIIEKLENRDLCNICLAMKLQNS